MDKTLILIYCFAISCIVAKPASNEQLDKRPKGVWTREEWKRRLFLRSYLKTATVNDIAANSVSTDKNPDANNSAQNKDGASVQITGITTGAETGSESTPFKPQKTGSMFARLIDDIFAIPITVLQNVAKLITNPFVQHNKTPEPAPIA